MPVEEFLADTRVWPVAQHLVRKCIESGPAGDIRFDPFTFDYKGMQLSYRVACAPSPTTAAAAGASGGCGHAKSQGTLGRSSTSASTTSASKSLYDGIVTHLPLVMSAVVWISFASLSQIQAKL